jgi:hypothetical protein
LIITLTKEIKIMSDLKGSDLTRKLLSNGRKSVQCVVSDDSDEDALASIDSNGYGYIADIASNDAGMFRTVGGLPWLCAVPIAIKAMTYEDVGLADELASIDIDLDIKD